MSRTLIAGTCYCPDEGKKELAQLWARVARSLNPGTDILLIDSASPFDPKQFILKSLGIDVWSFPDNIGQNSHGERDGSGRAFCEALQRAIDSEYDYVAFWEADLIFVHPVEMVVSRMVRSGVKVCSPQAHPFLFPEWGISFWDVKYLKETGFIKRYDWEHSPKWPIPEVRLLNMLQDDYWQLPLHGMRNEDNRVNQANIANLFPYSPASWLTHCADFGLYYRLLDLNRVIVVEQAA